MSKTKVAEFIQQDRQNRDLKQRSVALAATLMRQFQINPYGIDLVCWLANAKCRNNEEALRYWTLRQIKTDHATQDAGALEELSKRLNRRLSCLRDAFPY